jgi:hypothetical protein
VTWRQTELVLGNVQPPGQPPKPGRVARTLWAVHGPRLALGGLASRTIPVAAALSEVEASLAASTNCSTILNTNSPAIVVGQLTSCFALLYVSLLVTARGLQPITNTALLNSHQVSQTADRPDDCAISNRHNVNCTLWKLSSSPIPRHSLNIPRSSGSRSRRKLHSSLSIPTSAIGNSHHIPHILTASIRFHIGGI